MDEVSENWVEIKNKNVGNAIDAESEEDRQKIIYANYLEQKDAAPFSIEFKDLDIEKEYYVLFKVADTQGNIYTTNLAKVKN